MWIILHQDLFIYGGEFIQPPPPQFKARVQID